MPGITTLADLELPGHRPSAPGAGNDHPMRIMTRRAAGLEDPPWGTGAAWEVAQLFDSLAPQWHTRESHDRTAIVTDALERGLDELRAHSTNHADHADHSDPPGPPGPPGPPYPTNPADRSRRATPEVALELGSGIGTYSGLIAARYPTTLSVELSEQMQSRAHRSRATRMIADGSTLPLRDQSIAAVVLINSFLFPTEVDRLLVPEGVLVWVNSSGASTPIHLDTGEVVSVLPFDVEGVEARAGVGTWCTLRRLG